MLHRRIAACVFAVAAGAFAFPAHSVPAPTGSVVADSTSGGLRILCLGDSLTEGFGVSPEQAWPELLQQSLRLRWPDAEVINAGVSGSTSASAVSRLKWQLRRKPHFLVLALGANDGLRGVPPAETKKNLAGAIDLAKANGIVVLLAGMKMPPNYGSEFTASYEAVFTSLAAEKNVALLPFLLEGVAANPSLNIADGIHPNAKGHAILAQLVEKHLLPLLEQRADSRKTADASQ